MNLHYVEEYYSSCLGFTFTGFQRDFRTILLFIILMNPLGEDVHHLGSSVILRFLITKLHGNLYFHMFYDLNNLLQLLRHFGFSRGVGCIFYEMVSGRPMFPGSTAENELILIFKVNAFALFVITITHLHEINFL